MFLESVSYLADIGSASEGILLSLGGDMRVFLESVSNLADIGSASVDSPLSLGGDMRGFSSGINLRTGSLV